MELDLTAFPGPRPTGHICTDCGGELQYAEEVWRLQVIQPQYFAGTVHHHQVIDENDPEGYFLFEPYFFCFACWEKTYAGLKEDIEEAVDDPMSRFECSCCGSGIREWEYAGLVSLGEFQVSARSPNGEPSPCFKEVSKSELLCIYCLVLLNEGYIEMWENLSQFGECNDCVQNRCWRDGQCYCECACHQEQEHGEENGH